MWQALIVIILHSITLHQPIRQDDMMMMCVVVSHNAITNVATAGERKSFVLQKWDYVFLKHGHDQTTSQ